MILLPSPLPLGVSICHDTTVMAYAAYLRVYEPVSAFREPDRSRWTAYADAPARPRRRDSLVAEHAEAVRRVITSPQVAVPEQESEYAYIRRADGITYVCPWQTRLRCLLAYGRTQSADGDQAMADADPAPGAAVAPGAGPASRRPRRPPARWSTRPRCRGHVGG